MDAKMSKLAGLIEKFKPHRSFACSYGTVEVDGVLVRVAKENDDSWRIHIDPETGKKSFIEKFKPHRSFACSYGTVEVDGVLVRVAKENDDSWRIHIDPETGKKYFMIAAEDALQDQAIIRSARVSTGRDSKEVDEKAEGLIQALWREKHLTPFEGGAVFRLRFEVPIAYAQPLFQLFASFNEFSGRYSEIDGTYYTPSNLSASALKEFQDAEEEAHGAYKKLLELGVAREMARFAHLYRFYTKFYMTISLRHIMEFLNWTNVNTKHTKTEFW